MTDLQTVGRQWKLEAEAARLGVQRLRERTRADEQRNYSSGTFWGRKLVDQQITDIAAKIEATKKRLTQGKAQHGGAKLQDVLLTIEPEVLAAIAAKRTLDQIGKGKLDNGKYENSYVNVCLAIGKAVESEARFTWYERVAPKEFNGIKQRLFRPTTGTRQKETIVATLMTREGFQWARWSTPKKHQIGGYLLDCIALTVPWFVSTKRNTPGKKNGLHIINIHPELAHLKEVMMGLAELLAPLAWPMVAEPAEWSNEERGGYLTNEHREIHRLVRGQRGPLTLGKTPLDMLNTLQRVAYRINPVTANLMNSLAEHQLSLGSFNLRANEEPLPYPGETAPEEVLTKWKKDRRDQENRNASLKGRRYRTLEVVMMMNKFLNEDRFYIPWSYDWRGRVYPIPSFMSPQGTDMEKSLYLFDKARPVTVDAERWLAIQVANTAGKDKLTLDERVQWVKENENVIVEIAKDPVSSLHLLETFDSPWCGTAACYEYYHCVILKDQATTSLPVATDATCSGLQHLSAMTLDGDTGRLVNVSPTPQPQDAYKAVLAKTIALLREGDHNDLADWAEAVGRPIAKRVVMTVPYAAEFQSNKDYIKDAITDFETEQEKKGFERRRVTGSELGVLATTMREAMKIVVPGPIAVMEWIKTSARSYFRDEKGGDKVVWVSPSGFPVTQDKRIPNIRRVKTQLLGDVIKTSVGDGFLGPNVQKHCSGSAPNWIHSLDSALLHNSFAGFDQPFTLIHDSILTTATDMGYMSRVIRDEFVDIYKEMPLYKLAEALGAEVPEGMVKNTLDLDTCPNSVYFFC
jgi:DNA-directed RNA polymerase